MIEDKLRRAAATQIDPLVAFCRRLIQTPSPPGAEGAVAALVQQEMMALGYDDVQIDAAGNVIGCIRGGGGKRLMLNTHLDHVDPGSLERWPVPPFSGAVQDGAVWGRGAMDIKGPLACQVYAPALLRAAGVTPPGDLYVTAVVMEEVGGVGAQVLCETLRPDAAVVGEATACRVARGHRGRVEVEARFIGRGAHASVPELAHNPHYAAARFLLGVEGLDMVQSATFGAASVAPTLVQTDQTSPNVIPEELTLTLDWRTVPGEGAEQVLARLSELAAQMAARSASQSVELAVNVEAGVSVEVRVKDAVWQTYTGLSRAYPMAHPAFELAEAHPLVKAARAALERVYEESVPVYLWRFATDGGHYMAAGIPTVGFGPGDERLAHTTEEHISLGELARGLLGNAALCAQLGEVEF
jgi:succinyl-diaminopimelate desuccinylase